jgi:hypothetical protein
MTRPTKPLAAALRPRLLPQPGQARPAPKAIEHLRPHLQGARGAKPTIEKGPDRPKLR